jgi:hypothetical protein
MQKRHFLAAGAVAGVWPMAADARATRPDGPVILTVGGQVGRSNRPPMNNALDQMMHKHGVRFERAFTFDAAQLQRLAAVSITAQLEYDQQPHTLRGPLLTTVLEAAGVDLKAAWGLGLRAVDGYNVRVSQAQMRDLNMIVATHLDGQALALGGLGPQWAVYDPKRVPWLRDKPLNEQFALSPWGMYYIDVGAA